MSDSQSQLQLVDVQSSLQSPRHGGFSLIEMALAIGIIAFALLAVVALLPVGLSANRNSFNQARSMQTMNAIALSIQSARITGSTSTTYTYTALPPYDTLLPTWDVSLPVAATYQAQPLQKTFWVGANGRKVDAQSNAKYLATVSITPPKDRVSSGKAYIAVAWPGAGLSDSNITWSTVTTGSNPEFPISLPQFPPGKQGHVETILYFNPN